MSIGQQDKEFSDGLKSAIGLVLILFIVSAFRFLGNLKDYIVNIDLAYEFCRLNEFIATPYGKVVTYFFIGYVLNVLLIYKLFRKWKINLIGKFILVCFLASWLSYFDFYIIQLLNKLWLAVIYAILISSLKLIFIFKSLEFIGFILAKLNFKTKTRNSNSISLRTTKSNVVIPNPFAGIYIQGGAGSGKTESILKPIIKESIERNFSFIIYDFKGELTPFANQIMDTKGIHQYHTLNFKEPKSSDRFNPLNPDFLNNTAEVVELSKTLFYNLNPGSIKATSNNYFLDEAINLFTGIVIYLKNNKPSYCTIPHIISGLANNDIAKIITKISSDFEALPYVSSLKNVIKLGADKQVAGVIGSLQGSLAKFTSKDLFYILSGNDFTPDLNNPDKPNRLNIVNDSSLPSFYAPLISMVINICLKKMNVPDKHESAIFLDEAPTLYIPEFEQIPATARSNKIATVFTTQDYTQIVDKYGSEKAQTIISNLATQFYGRTTNAQSMRMISELFGKYDKVYTTKTKGTSGSILNMGKQNSSSGTSQSFQERYNVTSNELLKLKPGEFYSIIGDNKSHNQFKQIKLPKSKEDNTQLKAIRKLSNSISDSDLDRNYLAINKAAIALFN